MTTPPPIPFSEPPYLCGLPSPYYTPALRAWQKACRAYADKYLTPFAAEWDTLETVPEHVFETFARDRMLIPCLPSPLPVQELKAAGIHDILGVVKVEDFTYFHNLVYNDEMARSGLAGPGASLTTVGFIAGWRGFGRVWAACACLGIVGNGYAFSTSERLSI